MTTRRALLKGSALSLFGMGAAPAWLARAADGASARKKILVAVFQRGAMDGLNAVVPLGDKDYAALRPNLAIPRVEAIDLDGFFALNPALKSFKPLWDAKQLAILEATGSPDPTRSHFDAQDYMESGTPGVKSTRDGWLNRALPPATKATPLRAVSMGPTLARSLRGSVPAVAVNSIRSFRVEEKTYEGMYAQSADAQLKGTGREMFEAVRMLEALQRQEYKPANGAAYPNGKLGSSLKEIARLIKADAGLEVAFADMGGWDTHVNQPGQLATLLTEFSNAIAAFHADLGSRMEDILLLTMSEFGRTARENGNRGTDHGHGSLMFALGAVNGGKVYGPWPGLGTDQLYERRDLAVTTDFRSVLTEAVTRQLGVKDAGSVFPGFAPAAPLGFVRG